MEEICLEIMGKNEQICTVKFQNFSEAMPPDPILGRATAPLLRPHPLGTLVLRAQLRKRMPKSVA